MEAIQEKVTNLSKKQIALIAGGLSLIVITLALIVPKARQQSVAPSPILPTQDYQTTSPTPLERENQSPELAAAIAEQQKVQNEYVDWKDNNHTDYPWINKMPLGTEKYYVYFDLEKKQFIARLYPAAGEDVEQIKTTVVNLLTEKGVAPDSYPIEWVIFQ